MSKHVYWASCPELTGPIVDYLVDHATEITYSTFARNADLAPLRAEGHDAMWRISAPDNWAIAFYKSTLPSGIPVYFFDWSRIEHVFVPPDVWPDIWEEDQFAKDADY